LKSTFGECEELLTTADNTNVPIPRHLLGNLVDVVLRINYQSSSLLEMGVCDLVSIADEKKHGDSIDYSLIERDPARGRNITWEGDKVCLMEQGPFQPKLTRYLRNPDIKDKTKHVIFIHTNGISNIHILNIRFIQTKPTSCKCEGTNIYQRKYIFRRR
jgi:hypothetical protein